MVEFEIRYTDEYTYEIIEKSTQKNALVLLQEIIDENERLKNENAQLRERLREQTQRLDKFNCR